MIILNGYISNCYETSEWLGITVAENPLRKCTILLRHSVHDYRLFSDGSNKYYYYYS
jgi:hypothetical protein